MGNYLSPPSHHLKEPVKEDVELDFGPVIEGPLFEWRAANPIATVANVRGRRDLTDADFAHLAGIKALNMRNCIQPAITDAAFAHLRGIQTLDMTWCDQPSITNAAFAYLSGIHTLDMSYCNQITNAAFAHLRGIHTLIMRNCSQATITDAAFLPLRGIHTLNINSCTQFTNAAFAHLRGIHTLNMSKCSQIAITDEAFAHLRGIHTLDMTWCDQPSITNAAFAHLAGIHTLNMSSCSKPAITDAAFVHLHGIHTLDMSACNQPTITDAAFAHLTGIHTLNMHGCDQGTITDAAFVNLAGIVHLNFGDTEFSHRLFAAQYLNGSAIIGLSEPIEWLFSAPRPLSLEILSHSFALVILQLSSNIAPTLPLSQYLLAFLADYFKLALNALANSKRNTAECIDTASGLATTVEQLASLCCFQFIDTCGERVCNEVLAPIFTNPPLPLRQLADTKDNDGRTLYSLAKTKCRALFDKCLRFCGRYDLLPNDPREHTSFTCRVLFARDASPTCDPSEPALVALKLMRHEEHFQREEGLRLSFSFSKEHVIRIVRTHTPTSDPSLLSSLASLGSDLQGFKYVVVLPAGDKVCSTIIDCESQKADWPEAARFITHALASSLAHMHEKGVIHGDVKPRNIVRSGGDYLLIDLDATVRIGEPVSDKTSTAFAAPELLAHMSRATATAATAAAAAPLLAHPSLDMWSLGATLYLMLQKVQLFFTDTTDNLARAEEDGARLAAWTPQEQAAAVRGIEDRTARALVHDLLHCDPSKRPSALQVLQHPYITRKPFSSRLGGEVATFDVFLSYRAATEGPSGNGLVQQLYDALTAQGLSVWWDKQCLKDGKNWKEGFCAGATASRVFVPLLSSAAFESEAPIPWSDLSADSFTTSDSVDNVLLEHRLAVELQRRGYLTHIFPVYVGDCKLTLPSVAVAAVEQALEEQLLHAGLSLPLTPPQSVADIWRETGRVSQGAFLAPSQDMAPQLQDIAQRIWGMCRSGAAAAAAAADVVAEPELSKLLPSSSSSGASTELQAKLARAQAELARVQAEQARVQAEVARAQAVVASVQAELH